MRDDSGLPEDAREKSGTIERMGNGLLLLVNQLLDISKTDPPSVTGLEIRGCHSQDEDCHHDVR